jgi:hypothetical protein
MGVEREVMIYPHPSGKTFKTIVNKHAIRNFNTKTVP